MQEINILDMLDMYGEETCQDFYLKNQFLMFGQRENPRLVQMMRYFK